VEICCRKRRSVGVDFGSIIFEKAAAGAGFLHVQDGTFVAVDGNLHVLLHTHGAVNAHLHVQDAIHAAVSRFLWLRKCLAASCPKSMIFAFV